MKNFLYKNKIIYLILFSIVVVNFISIACHKQMSHQARVNTISSAMDVFNSTWDKVDTAGLELAKQGKLPKDVKLLRDSIAEIQIRLNENWMLVSKTDAAIEDFILSSDFIRGLELLNQLMKVVEVNDLDFNSLYLTMLELKKEKES